MVLNTSATIALISVLTALVAVVELLFKVSTVLKGVLIRRSLKSHLEEQVFAEWEVRRATPRYYVIPDVQSSDSAAADEPRKTVGLRESSFACLDRLLMQPWEYRFLILLADAAMGKTSLLLNYASYHWRSSRRSRRFDLLVLPLNSSLTDQILQGVPYNKRKNTVLFLDALDEDTAAINDHQSRIRGLLILTNGFRAVVITARTHFFAREEDIPDRTEIVVKGPTTSGMSKELRFHRLYLAPFTDAQVDVFLRKRFQVWHRAKRLKSKTVINSARELAVRPMLLSHIEDLIDKQVDLSHRCQIYEAIIDAWLMREAPLVRDPSALRRFSSALALRLMDSKQAGGPDRLPIDELTTLVDPVEFNLKTWQVKDRSLVNRDVHDKFKFAHRSIMEYLYSEAIMSATVVPGSALWTDEVVRFVSELISLGAELPFEFRDAVLDSSIVGSTLRTMSVAGVDLSGLKDAFNGKERWKSQVRRSQAFIDDWTIRDMSREIGLAFVSWARDNRLDTFRWLNTAFYSVWFGSEASYAPKADLNVRVSRLIKETPSMFDDHSPASGAEVVAVLDRLARARKRLPERFEIDRKTISSHSYLCGAAVAVVRDGSIRRDRNLSHFCEDLCRAVFRRYGDSALAGLVHSDASVIERMMATPTPLFVSDSEGSPGP